MKSLIILIALSTGLVHAEDIDRVRASRMLWRASLASLAAANAIDVHSSWGKHELNPRLAAGPQDTFSTRGALIKLGLQGGIMGFEYLVTRGHPTGKFYRRLAWINFGAAGAITGVSVHNYTVPRVH